MERELKRLLWKIDYNDLCFEKKTTSVSSLGSNSVRGLAIGHASSGEFFQILRHIYVITFLSLFPKQKETEPELLAPLVNDEEDDLFKYTAIAVYKVICSAKL